MLPLFVPLSLSDFLSNVADRSPLQAMEVTVLLCMLDAL